MTIAFLSSKSESVVTTLKSIKDSLDLVGGTDLIDFLSETRERSEFFDRLVVSENALTSGNEEQDFVFLKDYIESYAPNLEVVMAISRESGSSLADLFTNIFSAPMYTVAYLPERTSTGVLIEMVEKPILEIKAKYFSLDDGQIKAQESLAKENNAKTKKQKTSFFSKWFGGKKGAKEVKEEVAEEPKEPVNSFHSAGGVVSAPVISTPVSTPDLVAPPVSSDTSTVTDSEVKESINKLFGGIGTEESLEPTGDLSLNFSDFGESHYQTGFIPEDDLEDDSNSQNFSTNGQPKEGSGWMSVDSSQTSDSGTDFGESSDLPKFSSGVDFGSPVEQNFSSPISDFSEELPQNSGGVLPTLGVSLVVGNESSSFIAKQLKSVSGYYIIDTRRTLDLSPYIDESSYLSSESEFYEEGGNYYLLNVSMKDLPNLLVGKDKVIVNASTDSLSSLESQLGVIDHIIPVFSNDIARLESQLLEYENISPALARGISKSSPVVVGTLSEDVHSLLSRAVFSRINWKGLIK